VFLFTAALFYGHVLGRLRSERRRADDSLEWAQALEARVAERTSELHRLYEASHAASIAKTEFMASLSHEVRTPLHIIIGYADILLDGAATSPADGATLGRHIRSAASGLLHLVDNVLDLGRLELERVRLDPQPVRVADFVAELRQREWLAPLPGVTMRWEVEANAAELETDSPKLAVVVSNLVTNALKYTRAGEIAVIVRLRDDGARVDFRVEDTGPGIPGTLLARIREPFHESGRADGHKLPGVGLGLAIVYRYAVLLGAEVSVQSTVGRGTSFVVSMPRRAAGAELAVAV
jgi:signal transduction histidine kinase